jgi:hypothetical protein
VNTADADNQPAEGDSPGLVDILLDDVSLWQLIFLVAATLVVSLWNLDTVRINVLERLDFEQMSRVEAALYDPSDEIAARACFHILDKGEGAIPSHLVRTLYVRPFVAFDCLEQANQAWTQRIDERDDGADSDRHDPFERRRPELVPRHKLIASTLGQRWMTDLIEGTSNACETAHHARKALELADLDPSYRLMSCAVAADAEEVRQCCVDHLGGSEVFVRLLERPEEAPLREASFDFPALAGASFPSVPVAKMALGRQSGFLRSQLSDSPEEGPDPDAERFSDLQPDVQDWVVEVGCRIHLDSPARHIAARAFVPLVESPGCAPTDVPWSGMYSANSWSRLCQGMYHYRRQALADAPREAICGSLATATVDRAIAVAELTMLAALSYARQQPGVEREELEIAGDHFGERLYGLGHGKSADEGGESESLYRGDPGANPLSF